MVPFPETSMLKTAIPLLHVASAKAAEEFYCRGLGFRLEFAHRADGSLADPCYMGVSRDGVWLHLSSFSGDGVAGGVANVFTDDVDALHKEFVAKNVPIDLPPVDQTWGTREMYVKDTDRNTVRFVEDR
jgi:catechol 2,3-dioxygenase-like lactoylglutathione lyase family enzyme